MEMEEPYTEPYELQFWHSRLRPVYRIMVTDNCMIWLWRAALRTVHNRTVYCIVDVLSASVRTITAVTVVYTAIFALVSFSLKYMLVKSFMHNILA